MLGFLRDHFICKSLREIFSSEGYHLRGCSRVGYLLKKCKGCLEPKVQEGELELQSNCKEIGGLVEASR